MIQLLISRIKLPSVLATISRSPSLLSTPKRKFSEIAKRPVANDLLAKDVLVYSYDNARKFRLLNMFAFSQLFFWSFLAQWSYSEMRDVAVINKKIHLKSI